MPVAPRDAAMPVVLNAHPSTDSRSCSVPGGHLTSERVLLSGVMPNIGAAAAEAAPPHVGDLRPVTCAAQQQYLSLAPTSAYGLGTSYEDVRPTAPSAAAPSSVEPSSGAHAPAALDGASTSAVKLELPPSLRPPGGMSWQDT